MGKFKQNLIFLNLIALCFNAYALVYIGEFPVTISVCLTAIIMIVGIIEAFLNKKYFIVTKQFIICIVLIALVLISALSASVSGISINITSSLLYVFYFASFMFSSYKIDKNAFFEKLKIVAIIYTVCSLYGIYQFIAYIYGLPLQDLLIGGHMVDGFNTTNLVYLGNFIFNRAHSIYLEPSFLSKYAAIAIIILFVLFNKKIIKRRLFIFCCLVNLLAMVLSVSGTGILLLAICCVVYFVRLVKYSNNKRHQQTLIILAGLVLICVLIFAFNDSQIKNYILNRMTEIFYSNQSGGMRFTAPYLIMFFSFIRYFFGVGAGNEYYIIQQYGDYYNATITFETMASGYAKIGCELGFLGLLFLIFLLWSLKKKDKDYLYIYVIIVSLNFLAGNMLQTDFWCWMLLFNFKLTNMELKEQRLGVTVK